METPKNAPQKNKKMPGSALHKLEAELEAERESVFKRFPILFAVLGTFGVAATILGFEQLIEQSDLLADNPVILITVGLVTLILTGSLYKKLG